MARIRTIKPDLPQSESLGRVSREARLCFILLFTLADDAGRLRGNSRMLASLLYPYDVDAPKLIDGWLKELQNQNCILRYHADLKSYIEISKWLTHQKIDHPSDSKIPPVPALSRDLANSLEASGDPREASGQDQGREGIKEGIKEGKVSIGASAKNAPAEIQPFGTRLSKDFKVTDEHRNWARQHAMPDPDSEIEHFHDYWRAKVGKDARKLDWDATFRNWLRNPLTRRNDNGTRYQTAKDRQRETDRQAIEYLKQEAARRESLQGDPTDS